MKISEVSRMAEDMNIDDAIDYILDINEKGEFDRLYEKFLKEKSRLEKMQNFEFQVLEKTGAMPAGLDEAGRGPLAGPVVAAAVILPVGFTRFGLNDSKKVSEKRRNHLFNIITENASTFFIKAIDNHEIDKINILNATKKAMLECVEKLEIIPPYLLVDAVGIPGTSINQAGIIRGDSRSISIAAASILAKVYRDSLMVEYDKRYPEYGFIRNKGYGTAEHIKALKKYGPVEIHRRSFIKNIV
jgi:ribonuclease HII